MDCGPVRPEDIPWGQVIGVWEPAESGLARLDQALLEADDAVTAGWLEATRLTEAVRSAHLEGSGTTEERVALLEADSALGLVEPEDRHAMDILVALRSCDRLPPEDLLSLDGLTALFGRARRTAVADRQLRDPLVTRESWLFDSEARLADWLERLPMPGALPGLVTVGLALRDWHALRPLGEDTAELGRMLIGVLAWVRGRSHAPILHVSDRLARQEPRADPQGPLTDWLIGFLQAVAGAVDDGRQRLALLKLRRQRWRHSVGPRRGHSRLGAAADLALGMPLISGRVLVERLGVSPRGATMLINDLVAAGVICEVSGRSRFRVYAANT